MTTPSSPPIGMKDVATELGVSSVGLSLSASNVRTLAGVPSGAVSLHDLLGRSAYTPMNPSAGPDGQVGHGATTSYVFSVTPNGGVGPYTYQWSIAGQGGSDPGPSDGAFFGSQTDSSCTIVITLQQPFTDWSVGVYCAVTDSTGRTVNSNTAGCTGETP